jgi:prephenate dehydratase
MSATIALLGPKGTFSGEAALKIDPHANRLFCDSIEEVFDSVIGEKVECGIVPVENSLEGSVSATLEMLLKARIRICSEVVLDINHCLLGLHGTEIDEIKEVISHPHALAQCRGFLKSMKGIKTRNFPSTGEAAREVAEKKLKTTAAIAPRIAAKIYDLNILKEGVQDQAKNQTRFFVIALKCPEIQGKIKTSIIVGLKDRPGALYEMLGYFAESSINLTKIESRPTKKSLGDYIFYIDFIGDGEDKKIKKILNRLKTSTTTLKVLGSYSTE